jgi:rod shape-determining protein MreB
MTFLRSFAKALGTELYIDLGTANVLVMDGERGLIANEPSVIAYREESTGYRRIIAVGNDAKAKAGRTPGNLTVSRPLKDGVVADLDATEAMIKHFISSAPKWVRPSLLMSLPYGVSDIEKDAARDCGTAAGAKEVRLIEEPVAAAIGSGLDVKSPRGCMVIDIGGGTTEAAVISLCGIVHCEAVRIGGHTFDQAIVSYVRRRYGLTIGEPSAERLKIQIGSAIRGLTRKSASIRGIDFTSGLPREISLDADEVYEAISPLIAEIVEAAKRTLSHTPPELLSDIIDDGLVVAGGGALLDGIAARLSDELGVFAQVAEDPLLAIARGGRESLRDKELLARIELK